MSSNVSNDLTDTRLRILTYNIQCGIDTNRYREYLTRGWRNFLPNKDRVKNLNRISGLIQNYDIVGLQEVDSGSLRSGFIDQTEYLASRAGFPYWYKQVNRDIGSLAQFSNGMLSKYQPLAVSEHKLPGMPGRGAILCEFGQGYDGLAVCIMHLSLGKRSRRRQLEFVADQLIKYRHIIVLGDFNANLEADEIKAFMQKLALFAPSFEQGTYPSWKPDRHLDHILLSDKISVVNASVVNYAVSDHLPIGVELSIPGAVVKAA